MGDVTTFSVKDDVEVLHDHDQLEGIGPLPGQKVKGKIPAGTRGRVCKIADNGIVWVELELDSTPGGSCWPFRPEEIGAV